MPTKQENYDKLLGRMKEIALIGDIEALLDWDDRTQLPPLGGDHRAEQAAYIAGLSHEKIVNPIVGELLSKFESQGFEDPLSPEAVNVREWRRFYDRKAKLPQSLVEEQSRVSVKSQRAWQQARKDKDFKQFQPWLEKTVELKRQEAECIGYENEPYEPLLDYYEPGTSVVYTAEVLAELRDGLTPLLQAIADAPRKPDFSILTRDFPPAQQESFIRKVTSAIGYDYEMGKLDPTTHPFCTSIGPRDVRITTRYNPNFLNEALFGGIHEAGHAIYEQNLDHDHWGTPMGEAVSLGIHESQSRMWENFVGRSRAFWEYWYAEAGKHFDALAGVTLDDFHFAVNEVKPSYIRVEADEMTYNLHILLRFELEREIVKGNLTVSDLPGAWNERFKSYIGIDVPDDAMGCMQDIHWSAGRIGYFATYSLGNLNASQLFETAREQLGDLDAMFRRGEYTPLREWLKENIHRQGNRYRGDDLIRVVTGRPLEAAPLLSYLKGKFGALYGLSL